SVMFVRDCPASLYLSLRSNGILAGWFPAYDVNLAPYGVGTNHQRQLLMHAARNGIRLFDCGAGDEAYKQSFRDFDIALARGTLRRRVPVALAYRLQKAPQTLVTDFVLHRPRLREAVRRALLLIGGVRSRLHPH